MQQKQRLHKRVESVIFSLSISHKHTHTRPLERWILSVHVCELTFTKRRPSLTFSSCHGAKTPSALKPERNVAQLSLSLCPISLAHCLPLSAATEMAAFVLLSIPPSLSLYCLSALTLLPPFLPPCATAPQQSHLHCLHLSHTYISYITSLKTRQNLGILCLSKVQKEKKKVQNKKVHIYLAIKLPSNLLCEHSSISSAHWVYFGATSTTVKLSWRHF